jgi:hypothetical protein
MIRVLIPTLLLLGACATQADDSYSLGRGIVSYDELRRQTGICQERGGRIEPKSEGDPAQLSNYTCVISKGK